MMPRTFGVLLAAVLLMWSPFQAAAEHFRVGLSLNLGRPYLAPVPVYVAPVAPVAPVYVPAPVPVFPAGEHTFEVMYQSATGQWYFYGRYHSGRHAAEVAEQLRAAGWVALVVRR